MATHISSAAILPQTAHFQQQQQPYKMSAQYPRHPPPKPTGANSPKNASPTSPRGSLSNLLSNRAQPPQLQPPKGPIYVPAALRRTEVPAKQSPPKDESEVEVPASSWIAGPGSSFSSGEAPTISRISTDDLATMNTDTPLSPLGGPCTRNHWQPDGSVTMCSAETCSTPFSFFTRRHHCRKCGRIFCWQHSQRQVPLNEHALFHPEGDFQRACERCFKQFTEWEAARSRPRQPDDPNSPAVAINTPIAAIQRQDGNRVGSIATSFQTGWNWSTF
ncbi:hypothetical protein P154DRAFT_439399 [Amniculicola lignicola CBS 123094]|uniref:FYVE-type domain-containing protein n=1 Tax=Amniculicola lignicola CBS 123094 TaxID=1392246 RepID=A0A6A5WAB6_9PLEO|nr:hypothetical protein P154DRAFT_439399 [Amniculicola lignicola CBS 123094]